MVVAIETYRHVPMPPAQAWGICEVLLVLRFWWAVYRAPRCHCCNVAADERLNPFTWDVEPMCDHRIEREPGWLQRHDDVGDLRTWGA